MKLDDLDLLIANLAEESVFGQSDKYVRGLMGDAGAILYRYKTTCHLADSIASVLDEAQALCEASVPSTSMINRLREKGKWMQRAKREHLIARNASKLPAPRETPEDLAERIMTMALADTYSKPLDTLSDERVCRHIAAAIREDRLDTEGRP
jgi:hypothetical protein